MVNGKSAIHQCVAGKKPQRRTTTTTHRRGHGGTQRNGRRIIATEGTEDTELKKIKDRMLGVLPQGKITAP